MSKCDRYHIVLTINLIAIIVVGSIIVFNTVSHVPTYGEKEEEGIRMTSGKITDWMFHHSRYHITIKSQTYELFQNLGEAPIETGKTITITYKWEKVAHVEGVCESGQCNDYYYWTPVVQDYSFEGRYNEMRKVLEEADG